MLQPNVYLTTAEAAALRRVSKSTMEHERVRGDGPPFVRIGRRKVGYRLDTLQAWLAARESTSTSAVAA